MEELFGLEVPKRVFSHRIEKNICSVEELFQGRRLVVNDEKTVNNIQFFCLDNNDVILLLKHPTSLYFRGALSVKCLAGAVEVDGFDIKPDCGEPVEVYSFCSHSALCFTTLDETVNIDEDLEEKLQFLGVSHLHSTLIEESPFSCLLLLSRHVHPAFSMLHYEKKHALAPERHFYKGTVYFNCAEEYLNCIFDVYSGNRIKDKMVYSPSFRKFSDEILNMQAPKVLVCGGKGAGKSSSLRFLVNRFLSREKQVLLIDFDIGQSEFTVPGCVSVVLLTKPLLGPSYTHIMTPLWSAFLGHVNADFCLNDYFSAIDTVSKVLVKSQYTQIPWFINTMGYIKGYGLLLINDILNAFNLTHVVQLCKNSEAHENTLLSAENLQKIKYLHRNKKLDYTFKSFSLGIPSNYKSSITPKASRELMVTFYLSNYISSLHIQSIKIKMEGDLSSLNASEARLISPLPKDNAVLNGDIVAICTMDQEKNNGKIVIAGFGQVLSFNNTDMCILSPFDINTLPVVIFIRSELEIKCDEPCLTNFRNPFKGDKHIILTDAAQNNVLCSSLF